MAGVSQAAVVMATPLNKRVLGDVGFRGANLDRAGTDDLIVAVDAQDQATLENAMNVTEKLLSPGESVSGTARNPRSLAEALERMPSANLALISVPGQFAKREAMKALESNLHVFLFSSNVAKEDELELKQTARRRGLLMMGPDCGTAIINHTVLGFGNAVRRGAIGIVSASGTGLQEVSCLIHKAGLGISQGIGTGGGDLSDEVGGIMTIEGIRLLEQDDSTKTIVLVSKPPGAKTAEKILQVLADCKKPVVLNLLGGLRDTQLKGAHRCALTLEDAASVACELTTGKKSRVQAPHEALLNLARSDYSKLGDGQEFIRGLFAGGTLCYEAQVILQPFVKQLYSNAPLNNRFKIDGLAASQSNACIDMGADEFVVGRPHPMIDFTLRKRRILQEGRDPKTAVILLDVELGYGSNPDPAAELAAAIAEAKEVAEKEGRHLPIVASIVGTESDLQDLANQEKRLKEAGVLVAESNAQAARIAAIISLRGRVA